MVRTETIAKGIQLYPGECMAVLAGMEADSVDSCCTDPPYHLTSFRPQWKNDDAKETEARSSTCNQSPRQRTLLHCVKALIGNG